MKEYILPVHDLVVHPGLTVPVYVDTPESIRVIETAVEKTKHIVLAPQRSNDRPYGPSDIYDTATIGDIIQVLHMPDGALHTIVQTTAVVKLSDIEFSKHIFMANVTPIELLDDSEFEQTIALRDKVAEKLKEIPNIRRSKIDKVVAVMQNYQMPAFVDTVMHVLEIDTDTSLKILATTTWRYKSE